MKITIYHTESSVDPGATVPADQIDETLNRLEGEYLVALSQAYPLADVDFRHEDHTYGHEITGINDGGEYDDAMDDVQRILETVYETGNFWV